MVETSLVSSSLTVVEDLYLTSHTLSVANILCIASVIEQLTSMEH